MTIEKKFFAFFATYNEVIAGNKWFVAYYVPDYVTGKLRKKKYLGEINKYYTVEERLAECEKIKLLIEQNKPLPDYRGARRLQPVEVARNFASVILLLNTVLEERKINIDNTTYINYKSIIYSLDLWLKSVNLNDITIGNFTEEYARDFLHHIKLSGLANKTHNNYKVILGSLWKDIARKLRGNIQINNIWNEIKSLKKNTQPFKIYTNEVENKLALNLPTFDKQLWLYLLFTHYGFIRGTENRKLKIDCIDFTNKTITIKSLNAKNGKQRIVAIPDHLYNVLLDYKLNEFDKDCFIFSSAGYPSLKQVGKNYFNIKWNKFRIKFGISSEYKIYAGKHTGMIKANMAGVDVKEIQIQTGHHSLDQVNDYLATMNTNMLQNFTAKFPKLGELPKKENDIAEIKMILQNIFDKL